MLSLLAIFKNESLNLAEWIDSHAVEGVDRFVLINNNSTDDYEAAIASARHADRVTLLNDDRIHAQTQIYNDAYRLHIQNSDCEWLIVCDLDEFIFSRNGFATISDYLLTVPAETSLIYLPWKIFGSSGFHRQPQGGITRNFIWRDEYPDDGIQSRAGMSSPGLINGKYIVRKQRVEQLGIHSAVIDGGIATLSNSQPCGKDDLFHPIPESLLASMNVHINHYPIQSRHYFETIKRQRGSASSAASARFKDSWEYFRLCDQNIIPDRELADRRG